MTRLLHSLALLFALSLVSAHALAQGFERPFPLQPTEVMDYVGEGLGPVVGSSEGPRSDPSGVFLGAIEAFIPLVNIIAVLIMVITGAVLIITDDENQFAVARRAIIVAASALILINTAPAVRDILIVGFDEAEGAGELGAHILSMELLGFISFIETPLVLLGVLAIIISGIKSITSLGTDDGLTNIKRTIVSVMTGIIFIVFKFGLTISITTTREPSELILTVRSITGIALGYTALIAVAMIIVAGMIMILNRGDDEAVTRAKGIILKTVIGMTVIIVSAGIVGVTLLAV